MHTNVSNKAGVLEAKCNLKLIYRSEGGKKKKKTGTDEYYSW